MKTYVADAFHDALMRDNYPPQKIDQTLEFLATTHPSVVDRVLIALCGCSLNTLKETAKQQDWTDSCKL